VPRKKSDIVKDYLSAGFVEVRGGKGSHRKLRHSFGVVATVSGKDSDDAKPYDEKQLREKLDEVERRGGGN